MKPYTIDQLAFPLGDESPSILLPTTAKSRRPLATPDPIPDRILRRPEVQHVCGLSRSSLYRLIAAQAFPSCIRLSANSVGWLASEVYAWLAGRVAATRETNGAKQARELP